MNQIKIILLTCWYGPFPWYFQYFIHSCSYNPSIDFNIITDNEKPHYDIPDNVTFVYKTLDDIKAIATKKMGFKVSIDYAYKLCDFKPAYGFIFNEIISDYNFWGISDIDIVYGDIRKFITDDILNNYEVISSRHDYITGSFCLFRNDIKVNTLFMQSKDYKKVFSASEHFCFDECNFLFKDLAEGYSILDLINNIESMTYVVKRAECLGKMRAFFDFMVVEGTPGKISWNNGHIFYKNKYEAMFYHLVRFKNKCKKTTILDPIPKIYYFTPSRIIIK